MPITSKSRVEITANTGGMKSLLDGVSGTFTAGEWKRFDYSLPEGLHVQEVRLRWKGAFTGDYGFVDVVNPLNANGYLSPSVAVSVDDTTVTFASAGLAAPFDPANGGASIEFWNDADTVLVECRPIVSVSGAVVTLSEAVASVHSISAKLRCVLASFSPSRGAENVTGGYRLLSGDGVENIRSEHNYTDLLTAGLVLAARFKATTDVGTRELTINYRLRRPVA